MIAFLHREHGDLVIDPRIAAEKPHLRKQENGLVDADVAVALLRTVEGVVFAPGAALHVNDRRRIQLGKSQKTARMVVVSVAQDGHINRPQIDAQPFGVAERFVRRPRIDENLVRNGLDRERQPMRRNTFLRPRRIFNQVDDFHNDWFIDD